MPITGDDIRKAVKAQEREVLQRRADRRAKAQQLAIKAPNGEIVVAPVEAWIVALAYAVPELERTELFESIQRVKRGNVVVPLDQHTQPNGAPNDA